MKYLEKFSNYYSGPKTIYHQLGNTDQCRLSWGNDLESAIMRACMDVFFDDKLCKQYNHNIGSITKNAFMGETYDHKHRTLSILDNTFKAIIILPLRILDLGLFKISVKAYQSFENTDNNKLLRMASLLLCVAARVLNTLFNVAFLSLRAALFPVDSYRKLKHYGPAARALSVLTSVLALPFVLHFAAPILAPSLILSIPSYVPIISETIQGVHLFAVTMMMVGEFINHKNKPTQRCVNFLEDIDSTKQEQACQKKDQFLLWSSNDYDPFDSSNVDAQEKQGRSRQL